jgi:hypothetical protein
MTEARVLRSRNEATLRVGESLTFGSEVAVGVERPLPTITTVTRAFGAALDRRSNYRVALGGERISGQADAGG